MKSISILGSFCSRNIFNYSPIKDEYRIYNILSPNSIWTCYENSLNIPFSDIQKIDVPEFTQKMIDYELNKNVLKRFENRNTDYFMIDLMALSFPVYKISFNGVTTYTQNINIGTIILPKMKKMDEFKNLSYQKISIFDIPEDRIKNHLDSFCYWLIYKQAVDRIVLYYPTRATDYVTATDNTIKEYSSEEVAKSIRYNELLKKYTEFLKLRLGDIIYYEYPKEILAYDKNCINRVPACYHYTDNIYNNISQELLTLLPDPTIMTASIDSTENDIDLSTESETDKDYYYNIEEEKAYKKIRRRAKIRNSIIKWLVFIILLMKLLSTFLRFT